MTDHGFISLGKFSSARDSILEYLCNNGWANGSFGDVDAPTGYVYRISNNPADVHIPNTEVTSLLGDWFEANPEVTDSPELRAELVGHFLVNEDSNGFIHVAMFEKEETLTELYQFMENKYDEWNSDDEDHEGMELMFKVTGREINGKPVLHQMEVNEVDTELYSVENAEVWAVSEEAARAIAEQYGE